MKNIETPFILGYVEQAIGGDQDPLSPPISISKNGTLAKWRNKLNYIDLRVNDPGLKNRASAFREQLEKAAALEIKTIITLPEYAPIYFKLPPEQATSESEHMSPAAKRTVANKPVKLTYFKPTYFALSSAIKDNSAYQKLTVEECVPIIKLASEYSVDKIVVPVSEPGIFLDPHAEIEFKKSFKELNKIASEVGISLHLRNGGISLPIFKKFSKEFNCKLAYDIGIASLEGDDILNNLIKLEKDISIITLQQIIRGLDKFKERLDGMEKAMKFYVKTRREYCQSVEEKDDNYAERCLKRLHYALKDYYESCKNPNYNHGLYQSGDLNVIPFLKEIRKNIENGKEKVIILSMVPNTKNNEIITRNLAPNNFSVSL